MTDALATQLGLRARELVAFVGAGGKSTLLFRLGAGLASNGAKVLLTTTTKMGSDQARQVRVLGPGDDLEATEVSHPVMLVVEDDGHKVTGPAPELVDSLFAAAHFDYVLVEADGARGRSFKTPAVHEPVIPSQATLVVIVVGIDAIGRPIFERCHRPELVAELAGLSVDDVLDVHGAVRVLTHPAGVLRAVPARARTIVAVTKVAAGDRQVVRDLAAAVAATGTVERCVAISVGRPRP